MSVHPATQILLWCLLVAIMQLLMSGTLLVVGGGVLLVGFVLSYHKLTQLIRRTRWVFLSLWLIYAYSTPGHALVSELGIFSPGIEGLQEGGLQLIRLLAALAGLAILLGRLHRSQLMAGLYSLFAPLQFMGMSRERMAVRLTLTLQYVEAAMLRETKSWHEVLHGLFEPHGDAVQQVDERIMELPVYSFAFSDALLILLAVLLLWVSM